MTDNMLKLKNRAARLVRLVELNAPLNVLESEFWMITEAFAGVRRERQQKELDQYSRELNALAEKNAEFAHANKFPLTPWKTCTEQYQKHLINIELAEQLGVSVSDLEEWEKVK